MMLLSRVCLAAGVVLLVIGLLGLARHRAAGGGVRSQQGTVRIAAGEKSATATITAVDTTRTLLEVPTGGDPTVRLVLTDATTITAIVDAPAAHDIDQPWRLREFTPRTR